MAFPLQNGSSIDVERFAQGQYVGMETLRVKVKILLVDDDSTILAIASTLLRTFKYEVTAVKNSIDALSTLRVRRGMYDLVVTDYHMPGMNGLELQKVVQAEYKLPVIVMSADERECIIMKTLEYGAAFFIVKPIKAEDVKNIWQYAVAARKGKSVMSMDKVGAINVYYELIAEEIEETEIPALGEAMEMEGGEVVEPEEVDSMVSMAEIKERRAKRASTKRKHKKEKDINGSENRESNNPKRSKVVWTTTLHNLFLQALNQIGLDKAVPKKILEYMGVPGLTRENVASHLQKYRIFLRQVADKTYARSTSLEKLTKSSFGATHQSPINDFLEDDGLDYSKLSQSTLPADFCKNLSSSSPGSLIGSSSSGLSAFQLSSQSLDVIETGIGFTANSSDLQMISHRVNRAVLSAARLPLGNAVATTMNSLSSTNRAYLQQFQSREWPLVPLGRVGTIGNTSQGVEKQNTGPAMSGDSFLEKFSPGMTAEDSIDPIDDENLMNRSGSFMDVLTQGDPSVRQNDSNHLTRVCPSLLKKDTAVATPGATSYPNEANKEDLPISVEKTAAVPNTPLQHHAGEDEFFSLLFEQMHHNHHPLSDSNGDSMDIFSSCYESPFVGAPNQNQEEQGNEDRQRVINPTEPFRSQNQETQDQQLAVQDIPSASTAKQKDVWRDDHPTAEDHQIWEKDFVDSLLDSSCIHYLL